MTAGSRTIHDLTVAVLAIAVLIATVVVHIEHVDVPALDGALILVIGFFFGRASGNVTAGANNRVANGPPPAVDIPKEGVP